ncbi:glycosyltransferase [Nocardioides sp. 616]|uniref:glycosyltransferase n=1 Tax=Nocardioides sp. 616 TaxID=2268090 RepID=UPI000CE3EE39|nr:glycosyltransferase [Nocardioides sp. 616]
MRFFRSSDVDTRLVPWVPRALGGPCVAVLLGTDHHPFDRLVRWSEALAAESAEPWFVQHGSTRLPRTLSGRRMLGGREVASLMESVDVVITHGGPGLIMEARSARHTPIVVPRDPAHGEHVDGHQMTFARHLEAEGKIHLVDSLDTLREAVELVRLMGRTNQDVSDARNLTTTRFGALVDELHRQGPRPPRLPRQR